MLALQLNDPVPEEIDAGSDFSITIGVTAPVGLSLSGAPFSIKEADRTILDGELAELTGELHDTVEIALAAPEEVGEFHWTLVLPAREIDGARYDEASLTFSFRTRPHTTSLAVWGTPSTVIAGQRFTANVGAKCTAHCMLAGMEVEVRDEAGIPVATGILGDTTWPGTAALYWTAIDLTAPAEERRFTWAVSFSAAELHLPHGGAAASLGFVTVRAPDHTVSVRIVEKDTQSPVADVQVRLGVYRTSSDETGIARMSVPSGVHALSIWKAGYDAPDTTVEVTRSEEVLIEMAKLPEEDPFAFWRG